MENKDIFNHWVSTFETRNMVELSKVFGHIEDAYSHPIRHYHNFNHVSNLFSEIVNLPEANELKANLFNIALFHDVVYTPGDSNNEIRSAAYASEILSYLGVNPTEVQMIGSAIKATATHESNSILSSYFNDMDLSILGSTPETYQNYAQKIRQEFIHIPTQIYNFYRKRFLKETLKRPLIYTCQYYFEKYEAQARENLNREFLRLSK